MYATHPDTGFRFAGFEVPYFPEVLAAAKNAAAHVPHELIGWDIAVTEAGPVIIEGNTVPESADHGDRARPGHDGPPVIPEALRAAGRRGIARRCTQTVRFVDDLIGALGLDEWRGSVVALGGAAADSEPAARRASRARPARGGFGSGRRRRSRSRSSHEPEVGVKWNERPARDGARARPTLGRLWVP